MVDYCKMMRSITAQHAAEQHGVTVHDPYACEEDECRLCRDYFVDEKADRAYDEGKERA